MPVDYKLYPPNWKTEIRPAVLKREKDCCKFCKAPNKAIVCRGEWNGVPAYQDDDGYIFSAIDGSRIGEDYVGGVWDEKDKGIVRIVLTISHLNHDIKDNRMENLAALCQKCHLNHDKEQHQATRNKNKGLQKLF